MSGNFGSRWILGALFAGHMMATETAASAPVVTVRLANSASVSEATLGQGKTLAAHILEKAGVALTWRDCHQPGTCGYTLEDTEFVIYVVHQNATTTATPLLGFTAVDRTPGADVRRAGIYYKMIRTMSARFHVDESEVLGAALAHEIGHLLRVDHSPKGVMSAEFGRDHFVQARRGELLFSAAQSDQIRIEIERRKAAGGSRF